MQIESTLKDLPPVCSTQPQSTLPQLPLEYPGPEGLPIVVEGFSLPTQLLQLKWQLFYVQKSQQELATAILQLSSMILAKSVPSPFTPPPSAVTANITQPLPPHKIGIKRHWVSKENCQPKMPKTLPNRVKPMRQQQQQQTAQTSLSLVCQCDVCRTGEGDAFLQQPTSAPKAPEACRNFQTPLDLYVSYFFNSLENRAPLGPTFDGAPETANAAQSTNHVIQSPEAPLDLVTHAREQSPLDQPLTRTTSSKPSLLEMPSGITTPPNSPGRSTPRSSSPFSIFQQSKSLHEPLVMDDMLQLEEAASISLKPSWSNPVKKDRAIVVPNPSEPRELFVGGDPKVRLPIWAYKKCVYMVGREQKRPAGRLCLCLLQSLFSLRYLVSHNYSGSRQKRPIDPIVMKAVLRQAMMQFGGSDDILSEAEFSQGKLRDYLNNAFRVMAFRRRRGDRVKSPFWNDAGDPILSLDPPKDFRLNEIVQLKTVTPYL